MESNLPPDSNQPPVFATPPPLNRPPPPVIVNVPPPRRGNGWRVFAVILMVLLVLSLALNFKHAMHNVMRGKLATASTGYGPRLDEVVVREGGGGNKIAVIPVNGIITSQAVERGDFNMVTLIKEELKRARLDSEVKAVILKVDSPGGEVLASDEIANAIKEFETNTVPSKPVVVSMGSLAASGGYYISAPCDYIVANELTITGSIGVIMHGFNYRGLLDKIGVTPEVFKSGKYKDMLSGTKEPEEISPEEKQMVQNLINETFGKFKSVVAEGRHAAYQHNHKQGKQLADDWADYADGRILSGKEAYKLGFVDDIGDFDKAVDRAEELASVKKAELVEYQQQFDLGNIFRLFGESRVQPVKIELGMDLPKLRAGYLYFLSPTFLH